MSPTTRTILNLVGLTVVTLGLVGYAGATWVREAFFDDRYDIVVPLEHTGGIVPSHEVTVLGKGVGRVEDIDLTSDGVRLRMKIGPEQAVPRDTIVQILRRSAIGEQTVNFIPVEPDWEPGEERVIPRLVEVDDDWEAASQGTDVVPKYVEYPVTIPVLLENLEHLFDAVDKDSLGTTIHELANAVGGRGETLVDLNRESFELNETLVRGIPDFERLIDSSEPVLTSLQEHRNDLAGLLTNLADLSEKLSASRPAMESVIFDGRRALAEADALVRNERADLSCLVSDLRDFQAVSADNAHWVAQLLEMNRFFFGGFDIGTQWDPYRPLLWARVNNLLFEEAAGQQYEQRRPTPATKPGAACISPFGLGVNAVRQPDHQPPDPTSPGIDWAPMADEDARAERRDDGDGRRAAFGDGAAFADDDRGELPATGGGATALVGALTVAAAAALRRRWPR